MFGCTTQVLGWRNIHSANFQCAGFTTVESAVVPLKTARTSKQYDTRRQYPQWFHTNPEAAAGGRFGGLIARRAFDLVGCASTNNWQPVARGAVAKWASPILEGIMKVDLH